MLRHAIARVDKKKFALLLSFLLILVIGEIVLTTIIPVWREGFYNILETRNEADFHSSLIFFTVLIIGLGACQGLKVWAGQLVSIMVRQAATKLLFKPWVKGTRTADNYTQAMTDALRNATELYLEIGVEVFISLSIVVLLVISNLSSGSLLLAAGVYTVGMTLLAMVFNKPLIESDKTWQSEEGRLRETLSSLAGGADCYTFKDKFASMSIAYYRYIKIVMYFTLFSRVKASLASLVPYILLSFPLFSGEITLGTFMKGVGTFELLVTNATILLVMYPKLTKARASYQISEQFYSDVVEE